jgi:hypothetical protein
MDRRPRRPRSTRAGSSNSIALDEKERIRIAYFNGGDQDLRYAFND